MDDENKKNNWKDMLSELIKNKKEENELLKKLRGTLEPEKENLQKREEEITGNKNNHLQE